MPKREIIARAVADAKTLEDASFDGCILENYGDAPYFARSVPPATVALMAVVADRIQCETGLRLGINVLRNDASASMAIAAAVEADFVRVNVLTGVAATDQGMVEGQAANVLRLRKELGRRIAVLADVHVKHATPISEPDIARAARDTAYRGLADGLIVTGHATGEATSMNDLEEVRQAVPDRRIFVGSGANAQNVSSILRLASGVIVGSGIKPQNDPSQAVDLTLAGDFVRMARGGAAS